MLRIASHECIQSSMWCIRSGRLPGKLLPQQQHAMLVLLAVVVVGITEGGGRAAGGDTSGVWVPDADIKARRKGSPWAARYITRLLVELTPKGVVFYFLSSLMLRFKPVERLASAACAIWRAMLAGAVPPRKSLTPFFSTGVRLFGAGPPLPTWPCKPRMPHMPAFLRALISASKLQNQMRQENRKQNNVRSPYCQNSTRLQ